MNSITKTSSYRPSLLGRSVFDDLFSGGTTFSRLLNESTQGYPVADIYRNESGDTVMDFALAGFDKKELSIEVKPENRSVTVRAESGLNDETVQTRRIARRSFEKTYVNYDNNLDLSSVSATFENGLLSVVVPTRAEAKPMSVEIK